MSQNAQGHATRCSFHSSTFVLTLTCLPFHLRVKKGDRYAPGVSFAFPSPHVSSHTQPGKHREKTPFEGLYPEPTLARSLHFSVQGHEGTQRNIPQLLFTWPGRDRDPLGSIICISSPRVAQLPTSTSQLTTWMQKDPPSIAFLLPRSGTPRGIIAYSSSLQQCTKSTCHAMEYSLLWQWTSRICCLNHPSFHGSQGHIKPRFFFTM